MKNSIEYLREKKIILPAITTFKNLVWEAKNGSEMLIINTIVSSLNSKKEVRLYSIFTIREIKRKNYFKVVERTYRFPFS